MENEIHLKMPEDNPFLSSSDGGSTTVLASDEPSPSSSPSNTTSSNTIKPSQKSKKPKTRQLGLSITAPSNTDQYPEEDPAGLIDDIPSFLLEGQSGTSIQ